MAAGAPRHDLLAAVRRAGRVGGAAAAVAGPVQAAELLPERRGGAREEGVGVDGEM